MARLTIAISTDDAALLLHTLKMYRQLVERDTSTRPSARALMLSEVDLLSQTIAAAKDAAK